MTCNNRKIRFVNLLIAAIAAVTIAFACTAPIAFAEDGANGNTTDSSTSTTTPQVAGPVPNVIITNFTYGDGAVAVGSNFDLGFTFQNMGTVALQNMVVTVDGGENFAISGGTNTFYFDSLWAGYSLTQTVPMQVLSNATSGAKGITISFKYEYVENDARSSSTSDIKISVPVTQPDRFELGDPAVPEGVTAGEDAAITMSYVNKGKGDISNVEASIEGDGITSSQPTQYIGNVASGASGSIGFPFNATAAGSTEAKLRVTYEDSNGQSQTKEFTVTIDAQEAVVVPDDTVDTDTTEQEDTPTWIPVVIAVVAVAVIVLIVLLVLRRRKKTKKQDDSDDDWDNWDSGNSGDSAQSIDAPTQIISPISSSAVPGTVSGTSRTTDDSAKGQA